MTCGVCRSAQKDGFRNAIQCEGIEYVDVCPTGEVPILREENRGFVQLLQQCIAGLFDGFGAVRFEAFDYVCRLYRVPDGERLVLHDKLLIVVRVIAEIREKERKT